MLVGAIFLCLIAITVRTISVKGSLSISDCLNTTDFATIVNCPTFVDKTMFIKALFESDGYAVLITAPPHFGKSTNMNMIRRFLELVLDEKGTPQPFKTTESHKLFIDNNLKICNYLDNYLILQYFGTYPIIYIDFEPLRNINNYTDMLEALKKVIMKTYSEHKYLLHSEKLAFGLIDDMSRFVDPEGNKMLDDYDIMYAFLRLCKYICIHWSNEKYSAMLIDNYDSYFESLLFKNIVDKNEIMNFLEHMLCLSIKENWLLEIVVISGTVNPAVWETQGSTLHFIRHYRYLDNHTHSTYFGVTETELDRLITKFVVNPEERERWTNNAKVYSDGYIVSFENTSIYSWTILRYLQDCTDTTNYREKYDFLKHFSGAFSLPMLKERIRKLIIGGEVYMRIPSDGMLAVTDISLLHSMLYDRYSWQSAPNVFFYVLIEYGYLCMRPENYEELENSTLYDEGYVKIANLETTLIFTRLYTEVNANEFNETEITLLDSISARPINDTMFSNLSVSLENFFTRSNFTVPLE